MPDPSTTRCRRVGVTAVVACLDEAASGEGAALEPSAGDEAGQGMVEYALVLLFIAIVVIVLLTVLGHRVSNVFSNVSSTFH